MKAIQHWIRSTPDDNPPFTHIIHNDVVETTSERPNYKFYKCKCCGATWMETINSPHIIPKELENCIQEHYPKSIPCLKLKQSK